ncbi:hypothetical protein Glove_493g4 [Diversispora epigaea]|uniref:RNase H type-1 domain-containing protein n=1 Tax=Diversispora epigaea TaxID=1348612 RepID=A0A397GRM1_9GLOM|nr:hypothetical protein Glove_493g4 [Diversispora epigaea]
MHKLLVYLRPIQICSIVLPSYLSISINPSFLFSNIYFSDTISAIKSFLLDRWGRKTRSLKNQDILQAITDKCNGKQIHFSLFKVAAHSGIILNEKADKLAKTGANKGSLLRINTAFLQRNVNFTWNNDSLDINIKDFCKRERKVDWYVKWRTQYRVVKWCNKHISRETDWKLTLKLIQGTKMSTGFTDDGDQKNRTFNIKILNDELPVLRNLHMRKPEVYKSDICIICKQGKEDTLHPFEYKIIEKLAIIGKNQGSKFTKSDIIKNFRAENFMKIDMGRQTRGKNKIEDIQFQIFTYLRELMKLKWSERCQMVLAWEKENKIEGSNKRKHNGKGNKEGKKRVPNGEYIDIKNILVKQWGCDLLILVNENFPKMAGQAVNHNGIPLLNYSQSLFFYMFLACLFTDIKSE